MLTILFHLLFLQVWGQAAHKTWSSQLPAVPGRSGQALKRPLLSGHMRKSPILKDTVVVDPVRRVLARSKFHTSASSPRRPFTFGSLRTALIHARHRDSLGSGVGRLQHFPVYAGDAPNVSDASVSRLEGGGGGGALGALYKFTRPHTIRGTVLASAVAVVRALLSVDWALINIGIVQQAIMGAVGLFLGNVFIVGINQIYDKDVDKVNKPFLPVAAGEMSTRRAWAVVMASLVGGLAIVHSAFSSLIAWLYTLGLTLGTVYSVPPFSLKRFPLAAGGIIAIVRGFLLNFGVYHAVKEAFLQPFKWDPIVLFISRFMTVFAGMIAVTKDLPDVAGDKKYGIKTLANTYGVAAVATGAVTVLGLNYVAAIAEGIVRGEAVFRPVVMIGGHLAALCYLLWTRSKLESEDMGSVKEFYRRIWNLFYFEYALYALL